MNTQRRTFRGRGGPTDRRLPKHNARRRRAPGAHKPAFNKYQNDETANNREGDVGEDVEDDNALSSANSFQSENNSNDDNEELPNYQVDSTVDLLLEDNAPPGSNRQEAIGGEGCSIPTMEETRNPCVKEVQHLRKRVRNIRETMKLSNSIVNPEIYQNNVLNAVSNCVNEWRSIATHYPLVPENETDKESDTFYMSSEDKKCAALDVFEMIQHAIQCGPLAGAKPGYFKRCGATVANVAETFLEEVIPHSPALVSCMGFTKKQIDAMESWQRNAHKAVLEDKPPSRTASIHQDGKGTGKKAKKKQSKG